MISRRTSSSFVLAVASYWACTVLGCSSNDAPAPAHSGGGAPAGGSAGSGGSSQSGGGVGAAAGAVASGGAQAGSSGGPSAAGAGGQPAAGGASGGAGGDAPLPPITVWIAGDSTVATSGGTPCPAGWGGQFDQHFDDRVTIVNSAVGGRSVRTWLYSVQSEAGEDGECVLDRDEEGSPIVQDRWQAMLDGMQPGDWLFIQFGINDGSATCPRHVGTEAFESSYGLMAQAAKERGAQPVFLTPVSAIACDGSDAVGTRGFLTATAEAGTEYEVPVIDLHSLSVALYDDLGFCPIPGGDTPSSFESGPVGEFFCKDHTHFEIAGATQIAALVAGALLTQGLGLAAYLEP